MTVVISRRKGGGQEVGLWYGQDRRASVLVKGIVRGGGGDDQIIGIIPTGKKDADQGLVIVRIVGIDATLGGGGHDAQVANRGGHGCRSDRGAGGLANERAAV